MFEPIFRIQRLRLEIASSTIFLLFETLSLPHEGLCAWKSPIIIHIARKWFLINKDLALNPRQFHGWQADSCLLTVFYWECRLFSAKSTNACWGKRWSKFLQRPEYIIKCDQIIFPFRHPVASMFLISILGRLCISLASIREICSYRLSGSGCSWCFSSYACRTCRNTTRQCGAIVSSRTRIDWFIHRGLWEYLTLNGLCQGVFQCNFPAEAWNSIVGLGTLYTCMLWILLASVYVFFLFFLIFIISIFLFSR